MPFRSRNDYIRLFFGIAGLIIIAFALFSIYERVSIGLNPSLRRLALLTGGLLIIYLTIFGRKVLDHYQVTVVIVANVVVFVILLELLSGVILLANPPQSDLFYERNDHPYYYQNREWSNQIFRQSAQANVEYRSYLNYGLSALEQPLINRDESGFRPVPETQCSQDNAYVIHMYGGSALDGLGAPDWGTIPTYLQQELQTNVNQPLCIRNYGTSGYNSTQEVILLLLNLQRGERPDLTIFYDGGNDLLASYFNGYAGDILEVEQLRGRVENDWITNLLQDILAQSRTVRLIQGNSDDATTIIPLAERVNPDQLAQQTITQYLANVDLSQSIADDYGFEVIFVWQPLLFTEERELLPFETRIDRIFRTRFPDLPAFSQSVITELDTAIASRDDVYNFAGSFNDTSIEPFFDHIHITPAGNAVIAARIASLLTDEGLITSD